MRSTASAGEALHFGQKGHGLFVGEDSFGHATRIYPNCGFGSATGNDLCACAKTRLAFVRNTRGRNTDVGRG